MAAPPELSEQALKAPANKAIKKGHTKRGIGRLPRGSAATFNYGGTAFFSHCHRKRIDPIGSQLREE
jgi:hypothetical protein